MSTELDLSEVNAALDDVERDLADLSAAVSTLQEESPSFDDVASMVTDAVDEALNDRLTAVLEYAALRSEAGDSAADLLATLRMAVRHGV